MDAGKCRYKHSPHSDLGTFTISTFSNIAESFITCDNAWMGVEMASGNNSVGRRTVLQAIGGSVSAIGFSGTVSSENRTTEIVTVKKGNKPLKTRSVPREWWEHVESARVVRNRLEDDYNTPAGGINCGIALDSGTIGGYRKRAVTVRVPDQYTARTVPDSVNGISIRSEEATSVETYSSYCDIQDEDFVPGGGALGIDGTGEPGFTATCPVSQDGDHYLLTVAHAFEVDDCKWAIGVDVSQGESMNYFGTVAEKDDINGNADYALIQDDSDLSFDSSIKTSSSNTVSVSGYMTEDGLEWRKGDTVEKYGAKTCYSTGTLGNIGTGGHCKAGPDWFEVKNMNGDVGDSGAPIYHKWEDSGGCEWASIAGVLIGAPSDDSSKIVGLAAYEIASEEEQDVEFGYRFTSPCGPIE